MLICNICISSAKSDAKTVAKMEALKRKAVLDGLSATAPCAAMYSEWTAEEQQRLKICLSQVFNWKAS